MAVAATENPLVEGLERLPVPPTTLVIFGEAIWDPVAVIARIGNAATILIGALLVVLAQLTTNMAANVVSPANDFSNLSPRRITYVTGGLIRGRHAAV